MLRLWAYAASQAKSQQAYVCIVPTSKLSRSEPVKKADLFHAGVVCSVFQARVPRRSVHFLVTGHCR